MSISRRRFLTLISTTTAAILLRETGVIALPRRLVLDLSGSCSFCDKVPEEVFGMAGTAKRTVRICSECITICLDILQNEAHKESLSERDPPPEAPEPDIDELMRAVEAQLDRERIEEAVRKAIMAPRTDPPHTRASRNINLACSFCDKSQREVAKLIAGPTVYICDTCVGDSASFLFRSGWSR
jgi:hypothetical protein